MGEEEEGREGGNGGLAELGREGFGKRKGEGRKGASTDESGAPTERWKMEGIGRTEAEKKENSRLRDAYADVARLGGVVGGVGAQGDAMDALQERNEEGVGYTEVSGGEDGKRGGAG